MSTAGIGQFAALIALLAVSTPLIGGYMYARREPVRDRAFARRQQTDGHRPAMSDRFDGHVAGARGKGFDVCLVARENRSTRLGESDHDGVDGRTLRGPPAQLCSPSRKVFGDAWLEYARLQQAIRVGVTPGAAVQRLDKNDGGDDGRPEVRGSK